MNKLSAVRAGVESGLLKNEITRYFQSRSGSSTEIFRVGFHSMPSLFHPERHFFAHRFTACLDLLLTAIFGVWSTPLRESSLVGLRLWRCAKAAESPSAIERKRSALNYYAGLRFSLSYFVLFGGFFFFRSFSFRCGLQGGVQ